MRLYSVNDSGLATETWFGTLALAKAKVNEFEPVFRSTIRVDECEVKTDKASVLLLLNDKPGAVDVVRSWNGTARGGLKEVTKPKVVEDDGL